MYRRRRRVRGGARRGQATRRSPGPRILFIVGTMAVAVGLYVAFGASDSLSLPLRHVTALHTVWAYNALGGQASVDGTTILAKDLEFLVVEDCTPVGVVLLVWGAIVASPMSLLAKVVGITLSALLLTGLNLVRLVNLVYVGAVFPDHLDTAHLLVWQPLMILAAIVFWFFWFQRCVRAVQR